MSFSATIPAPARRFAGVETQTQREQTDGSRSRDRDRADTARTSSPANAVALEPHWQASIEIATD